mgnify:CR=1 FL=1
MIPYDDLDLNLTMSIDDAIKVLKCSKRTLRRYVNQGFLIQVGSRPTTYSAKSVYLLSMKGKQGLLQDLSSIVKQQADMISELRTRVGVLESVFLARGSIITSKDISPKEIRDGIKDTLKGEIDLNIVENWSDDLLRFDHTLCREIGFSKLRKFVITLIASGEACKDVRRILTKRSSVEKLRWFLTRLDGYASVAPSGGQARRA